MADKKTLPPNSMTGEDYVKLQIAKQFEKDNPQKSNLTNNNDPNDRVPSNDEKPEDHDESKRDFAEKKSIFSVLGGKMILFAVGCVGLVVLVAGGFVFYKVITGINKPTPTPTPIIAETTVPELIDETPIKTGVFGYIKDKRSIWTIDIDGKNRNQLMEISSFRQKDTYTDLTWKNERDLSYAICPLGTGKGCKVYTYNLDTKSQNQELNLEDGMNIASMQWSNDRKYFAMIAEDKDNYDFYFKSGTVLTKMNTFLKQADTTRTKARAFFSDNQEYVIYYAYKRIPPEKRGSGSKKVPDKIVPIIEIYRLNGVKVDSMEDASDPFVIDESTIGFKRNNILYYKKIGQKDETKITTESGLNPVISPNKSLIAYWNNEVSDQKKVVLQVFDTNLNIRRDILRGIILPIWLSDTKIAGIKSDNCLGDECLLFEFQTAGLVVVDIKTAQIYIRDQGALISNVALNQFIKTSVESADKKTPPPNPEVTEDPEAENRPREISTCDGGECQE